MGTTTKGIPYPEDTDQVKLGDQAIAALANDLDFTKVMTLDPAAINNATLLDAYPLGTSVLVLSAANAAAGAWPYNASSMVLTVKFASDRATQFQYRNIVATPGYYYRNLLSGGQASAWAQVGLGGFASGNASLALPTAGTQNTVAVTFPAGRFTAPPVVMLTRTTGLGSSATTYYWPTAITTAGFTLSGVSNAVGGAANIGWLAVQTP